MIATKLGIISDEPMVGCKPSWPTASTPAIPAAAFSRPACSVWPKACGVADAKDVPVAIGAGNRIGVTAGHDVEDALLIGHVRDRGRQCRVDVADQEIDLIAIDQLTRLLDCSVGVAACRLFDQELHRTAENAALGIDLGQRELRAEQFVLPERGVSARQWIIETDFHRFIGK
jgi:hypothetical protein